jgi:hypothetical protein
VHLIVIGDIHMQAGKLWRILQEAELADEGHRPTTAFVQGDTRLVLLGDLVHAKSRERYAELINVRRYDEYNPRHLERAEKAQTTFLREVKGFQDRLPQGKMVILMGNHDFNAVHPEQGPLRTDDVSHLEWKVGYGGEMDPEIRQWILAWPSEVVVEELHLAHVGPLTEHNTYDNGFYLENRRRWIYEERDFLEGTPYRLGVYGHTPVRGGVNIASQGRAILLDTNGYQDEYSFLDIDIAEPRYRLRMRGLFFDEIVARADG